jgi:cell division protein FtsL
MTVKKIVALILICTIPLVLFVSSVQAYNYMKLKSETEKLEAEQKEWIEKNKKLVASIEVLKTPERIEKIVRDELGLQKIDKERVVKVVFEQ